MKINKKVTVTSLVLAFAIGLTKFYSINGTRTQKSVKITGMQNLEELIAIAKKNMNANGDLLGVGNKIIVSNDGLKKLLGPKGLLSGDPSKIKTIIDMTKKIDLKDGHNMGDLLEEYLFTIRKEKAEIKRINDKEIGKSSPEASGLDRSNFRETLMDYLKEDEPTVYSPRGWYIDIYNDRDFKKNNYLKDYEDFIDDYKHKRVSFPNGISINGEKYYDFKWDGTNLKAIEVPSSKSDIEEFKSFLNKNSDWKGVDLNDYNISSKSKNTFRIEEKGGDNYWDYKLTDKGYVLQ